MFTWFFGHEAVIDLSSLTKDQCFTPALEGESLLLDHPGSPWSTLWTIPYYILNIVFSLFFFFFSIFLSRFSCSFWLVFSSCFHRRKSWELKSLNPSLVSLPQGWKVFWKLDRGFLIDVLSSLSSFHSLDENPVWFFPSWISSLTLMFIFKI